MPLQSINILDLIYVPYSDLAVFLTNEDLLLLSIHLKYRVRDVSSLVLMCSLLIDVWLWNLDFSPALKIV